MGSRLDNRTSVQQSHFHRKETLRKTLRCSQQEAVASATMTGTGDNFLNAFAIHLQANALQMGWLTAVPQLFGALSQIVSVWLGGLVNRKSLVVGVAYAQGLVVALMAVVAIVFATDSNRQSGIKWLILLAIGYFSCLNIIQPHWRAWMGSLVPQRRRGVFFASRTRLTMVASLLVFITGGLLLTYTDSVGQTWLGFALLFAVAALGRIISGTLLMRMHDPDPVAASNPDILRDSWRHVRESLRDPTFRHYSFFVAAMQGAVAISAPFFAVYMLRDLQFSYLQYSLTSIASIATQFVMLHYWGRFSDRFGNHLLMVLCSCLIPVIPLFWLVSSSYGYLIVVQMISGLAWSGFTLSTVNYLYDIRPHQTNFALYAAIQAGTSALLVFVGGVLGGIAARNAPAVADTISGVWQPENALFLVFILSALLRMVVAARYLPLLKEPKIRHRPRLLDVIVRISRFNAISGISLDWMSITRKRDHSLPKPPAESNNPSASHNPPQDPSNPH